jgi:hypothetical protein
MLPGGSRWCLTDYNYNVVVIERDVKISGSGFNERLWWAVGRKWGTRAELWGAPQA